MGRRSFTRSGRTSTSLHGLLDEKYPSERLEKVLRKYMGDDTKLSEALTEVLITSYEIESCRPFFFTRRKARAKKTSRLNPRMWEVARCTSAAPTYFSPFQIKRARSSNLPPLTLIDAGVFVNNPTLCAYAEAVSMQHRPADVPSSDVLPGGSKQSERPVEVRSENGDAAEEFEYVVLSLGTGELNVRIRYEDARRWGTLHWARPLIDIAYDGSSDTVDGQMRQLMHVVKHPYLYYRFQPSLSEANNALDDTSEWNIQDLKRRAASIFDDPEKLEKIENLCGLLQRRMAESKAPHGEVRS